ncbi:Lactoylglutathione lyase [Klebsiella pneumoniae]|nr:Lactoylglutathione lyase [Klebsiella pneumoniae]
MKIAHFALWTQQLDVQARFWVDFFAASINEKYLSQTNPGFASYFVTIDDEVVIELMTKPGLQQASADNNHIGWAHLALSVGGAEQVDAIAQRAGAAGILISPPRTTGDGYYEAVIADPDGNLIEIVAYSAERQYSGGIHGTLPDYRYRILAPPGPFHFLPPIRQPQL